MPDRKTDRKTDICPFTLLKTEKHYLSDSRTSDQTSKTKETTTWSDFRTSPNFMAEIKGCVRQKDRQTDRHKSIYITKDHIKTE